MYKIANWFYYTLQSKLTISYARFYELGLTRDSRIISGLTVVSILST